MEYLDWNAMGSFSGAALAVGLITQMTKGIPAIKKMPTQLWSYLLSLAALLLSQAFTAGLTLSGAVLSLFNAAMVSLAANGGYQALIRMKDSIAPENTDL